MKRDLLSPLWTQPGAPDLSLPEWESLLSQARRARLLGRVALHLADRNWLDSVPDGPRVHLRNALRAVQRQRDDTRWEADCIRRALAHVPTPVVMLKGAAYVLAGLSPARGRIFSDVDILVARPHLREVENALFASGWIAGRMDPYDERYYRDWMHELPPLQHIERGSALDVHHTITPPTSHFAVDAAVLLADIQAVVGRPGLSVLAPADMVLHSVAHLMQDGDFSGGLRDLLDVSDLLQDFARDAAFWPKLMRRAQQLQLGVPLRDVLTHARRLAATEMPADIAAQLQALSPGRWRNRLMDALLATALRPDHPDCDGPFSRLSRRMLYVRSHWLRMPWFQVAPHLLRKGWRRLRARGGAEGAPRQRVGLGM